MCFTMASILDAVLYPQDMAFCFGYKLDTSNYYDDYVWQEEDKSLVGIFENNNDVNIRDLPNLDSSSNSSVIQQTKDQLFCDDHEVCTSSAVFDQSQNGMLMNINPVMEQEVVLQPPAVTSTTSANTRRKRRRAKNVKNKEEIENQRMTHIAVERNRRKQMNEYLAVLRSLMPASYVQRGDQASIVGSAINFVKELEQLLQTMEAHKRITNNTHHQQQLQQQSENINNGVSPLFAEFFTFPQYTTRATQSPKGASDESMAKSNGQLAVADIEVTMVERHANIKILTKKRPRQLLHLMAGLQGLRLCILHLNVTTTLDHLVLYSVSVKVEEGCHLNTVDEIAAAVNHMLHRIAEDAAFS